MVGKGNVGWTAEADELWSALRTDQPWPLITPAPSSTPSVPSGAPSTPTTPVPSITPTADTAAAATCTEGNNRVK